jgi:hypothetical protein
VKRLGFAALFGTLVGLVLLGVLGHKEMLPQALQGPYNSLVGRVDPSKESKQEAKLKPTKPKQEVAQAQLPKKVELPQDDFYPVALIQTQANTHLVYLEQGHPKLVTTSGWVRWTAAHGLERVMISSTSVQSLGPGGRVVESRASSSVDVLSHFDYESATQTLLFPKQARGLDLEAEDLENPELAAGFYVRVKRRILGFVNDEVVLEKKQDLYMGGAHAVHEMEIERIRLSDGQRISHASNLKDSKGAFEALRNKEDRPPCASVHKGTVDLRGPMGVTIPVALAVGELGVCASKSTLHWEGFHTNQQFTHWPAGFSWVKEKLQVLGSKSEKKIQDLMRLRELPALLVFSGEKWLPGFAVEGEQPLLWMLLQKGLPHTPLGSIGPVLGTSALDPTLMGARESLRIAQVFGLR